MAGKASKRTADAKRVTMQVPVDARDAASRLVTVTFERVPKGHTVRGAARGNPALHAVDSHGVTFCSRGVAGLNGRGVGAIRPSDWKGDARKGKAVTCAWCELRMLASGTLSADAAVTLLGKACGTRLANEASGTADAAPKRAPKRGTRGKRGKAVTADAAADSGNGTADAAAADSAADSAPHAADSGTADSADSTAEVSA